MPAICYVPRTFNAKTLAVIEQANAIIAEYAAQGFSLTLRQLFYQFVARALIPNRDTEYQRLGSILNDARLAGLVDWAAIEDRTRWLRRNDADSGTAEEHLASVAGSYSKARWDDQEWAPEVWIEKDALVGIVEAACSPLYVPYFACRGYVSASEMWLAGQRMIGYQQGGRKPILFHLGDHDPSGIHMTTDLEDRLAMFCHHDGYRAPLVVRLALNMDQVDEQQPPPNAAKLSDSRAPAYIAEFGDSSWELDALDPTYLATLITDQITPLIDWTKWRAKEAEEAATRDRLNRVAQNWQQVDEWLDVMAPSKPPDHRPPQRDFEGKWE